MPAQETCDAVLVLAVESPLWAPRVYRLTGERDAVLLHARALYDEADHDERAFGGIQHAVLAFTAGEATFAYRARDDRFVPLGEAYDV
jgi:hypothetical protein